MKKKLSTLVMTVVAAALVLSGCQTAPAETPPAETLPQPEFPLTEEAVNAALEQSGFPGEISAEETQSYQEGHIAYSIRDDSRTYTAGGNAVLSAGISSSLVDGVRFLAVSLPLPSQKEPPEPFQWEDMKPELVMAALLYGGFTDEEEIYRAFSEEEFPQEQKVGQWTEPVTDWGQWTKDLTGGYCQVTVKRTREPIGSTPYTETRTIKIFQSEEAYQDYQKSVEEAQQQKTQQAPAS
jgi:hypothetical protein